MKRTTTVLGGFVAAAALLLAGCGSDTTAGSSTPAATTTAAMSSAMPSSDASQESSSSEAPTSDASSSDAPSSDDSSSSEPTSSGDASSSSMDTAPTTTVGGEGTLDETSTKWFETYCSGVSPALDEAKKLSSAMGGSANDPKALLKTLSSTFTVMGKSFTSTAKDLADVPAPTFSGGDTLASTVLKAMNTYGPKFTELGTELAKADPNDPNSLKKLQSIGSDMAGLQDLARFKVDSRTLAAIKEVPSCKSLFSMGG